MLEIAGTTDDRVTVTESELRRLRGRVGGVLLRPGEPGWSEAISLWNGMLTPEPALVLQPTSTAGVAAAVNFAREHALRLSVKGGGHHIAGISIADGGLMLDMSRMNAIEVDAGARRAHVGPGCRLGDVDRATQRHGFATVLGFISKTGVAGLVLGGGFGYLARRFGWAVDNLEEVEIVTADGTIRPASRQQNEDLFWAVRGAGANFGVVTRFTLRLHEVGPTVYGGLIAWPYERADEIVRGYRRITATAPRELAIWLILLHAPPAPFVPAGWHGKRICAMAVCFSGDVAHVDTVLAPIRALDEPIIDLLHEQPYVELQSYLDDTEPDGLHHYWKTEFIATLSDDLLATMQRVFEACPSRAGEVGVLHIGGAINEQREDDGAVGNRDACFALGVKAMWSADSPDADATLGWVRGGWAQVRPHSTGRTYINFQTADEDDERVRATYGANFERLVALKTKYDPDNLFRSNRNIRPQRRNRRSVPDRHG